MTSIEHTRRWRAEGTAWLRQLGVLCTDIFSWVATFAIFSNLPASYRPPILNGIDYGPDVVMCAGAQAIVGVALGLYRRRWRRGSLDEARPLVFTFGIAGAFTTVTDLISAHPAVPVPVAIGVALFVAGAFRFLWRLYFDYRRRRASGVQKRMIIFGAGDASVALLRLLHGDSARRYAPVALLDDDHHKHGMQIEGVAVMGGRSSLAAVAKRTNAELLLIAIPSATGHVVGELFDLGQTYGLEVRVLPPVGAMIGRSVQLSDIRALDEEDLLGRHAINTDTKAIAGYLTGKVVLVTGAGGSIGAELCRHIARFNPSHLVVLDRDESALHALKLSLDGTAFMDMTGVELTDIRDREELRKVFSRHQPDVVFHVAALKHLPVLQQHPAEAVKTNIYGTLNVLRAAQAIGVPKVINVSTDKAASPSSVLGASKRIAERLTSFIAASTGQDYVSVRFGNVLNSRGSAIPAFYEQVRTGRPITITHPDVTRYFMTSDEASQLIVQAGAIGRGGDVLILDMGEPVRITDIVRRIAVQANREAFIKFTGLRPGEKLHEDLVGEDEQLEPTSNPSINRAPVPPLRPAVAIEVDTDAPASELQEQLLQLCRVDPSDITAGDRSITPNAMPVPSALTPKLLTRSSSQR
jgi:FlaA1/EpsC-like NDP-sugar epimerase